MISAEDYARMFTAKKAATKATNNANAKFKRAEANATGADAAEAWLNDYKGSVKKHLVEVDTSNASPTLYTENPQLTLSDEEILGLKSYIAQKVQEERND